jgi:hypothetical protein
MVATPVMRDHARHATMRVMHDHARHARPCATMRVMRDHVRRALGCLASMLAGARESQKNPHRCHRTSNRRRRDNRPTRTLPGGDSADGYQFSQGT